MGLDSLKILVVSQHYYPEQFRITDICETLVEEGHEVTVITGLPNYPKGKIFPGYLNLKRRKEKIRGVTVLRTLIVGRGSSIIGLMTNYITFFVNASIKILFIKKDFDIVYVYQTSPVTMAIPALLYKKITGKKVVHYCLDLWPESIAAAGFKKNTFLYKILLLLSRWIYNSADRILVTSSLFTNYFNHVIKLKNPEKVLYLPQYAEDLYKENLAITTTNKNNVINLLFAGNIGRMQSVETIIQAAAILKNDGNIKWHIVGDGSSRIHCERLVSELGLEEKVIFYGQKPVEEMPLFFSMASALIVTLKDNEFISYTLPGKVQSYMAAGKPLLGAINGETRKVIEESKCGLCCEAENSEGFAQIVKQFANNIENHQTYAENARRYYEEQFSKNVNMVKMNNILKEMKG